MPNKIVGLNISTIIQDTCIRHGINYQSYNLAKNKGQINKDIRTLASIRHDIEKLMLKVRGIKNRYLQVPDIDKIFDEVLKAFDNNSHRLIIEANKLAKQQKESKCKNF